MKTWTVTEIRALARQTVDGKKQIATARGAYFRALIETTQSELAGKSDQSAQLAALKIVHRKFYTAVLESIGTDEILLDAGIPKKGIALERNRRMNFARTSYGAVRGWLRGQGHDLMKLDVRTVTKGTLAKDSPPPKRHALTAERARARAKKLTDGLVDFTKQLAKTDEPQAHRVLQEAVDRLMRELKTTRRLKAA